MPPLSRIISRYYGGTEVDTQAVVLPACSGPVLNFGNSVRSAIFPIWSRDGRELYFISAGQQMMAVEVKGDGKKVGAGVPFVFRAAPATDTLPGPLRDELGLVLTRFAITTVPSTSPCSLPSNISSR